MSRPPRIRHAEPDQSPPVAQGVASSGTGDPANLINVVVAVPETIEVRLVDAKTLDAMEEWAIAFTVSLAFLTGFAVATLQEFASGKPLAWALAAITAFLAVTTGLFLRWALKKRGAMLASSRTVRLGGAAPPA